MDLILYSPPPPSLPPDLARLRPPDRPNLAPNLRAAAGWVAATPEPAR